MAVNGHLAVAIAQTVFYVPIVPLSFYIVIASWKSKPRTAWTPLIMFSLFRLVGGILTIVLETSSPTEGLTIATLTLLNVGLVSLIANTVGVISLVLKESADKHHPGYLALQVIRFTFITVIVLLVAGGAIESSPNLVNTGIDLGKAGYIIYAAIIALCTLELVHMYTQKHRMPKETFMYVQWTLLAMPPLVIRAVYGILLEFTSQHIHAIWNPLYGDPIAFALMCLLTEYLSLLVFIFLGLYRVRHPGQLVSEKQRQPESQRSTTAV